MTHLINISSLNSPPKVHQASSLNTSVAKNEHLLCTYSNPNTKIFTPIIQQYGLIKNVTHLINILRINIPPKESTSTIISKHLSSPNIVKTSISFVLTVTLTPKFSHQLSNNMD